MSARYPKSRLPGPAVRLFDMEVEAAERDETVREWEHAADTVVQRPEVEWVMVDECRRPL